MYSNVRCWLSILSWIWFEYGFKNHTPKKVNVWDPLWGSLTQTNLDCTAFESRNFLRRYPKIVGYPMGYPKNIRGILQNHPDHGKYGHFHRKMNQKNISHAFPCQAIPGALPRHPPSLSRYRKTALVMALAVFINPSISMTLWHKYYTQWHMITYDYIYMCKYIYIYIHIHIHIHIHMHLHIHLHLHVHVYMSKYKYTYIYIYTYTYTKHYLTYITYITFMAYITYIRTYIHTYIRTLTYIDLH